VRASSSGSLPSGVTCGEMRFLPNASATALVISGRLANSANWAVCASNHMPWLFFAAFSALPFLLDCIQSR